jgi:hypothetical protein
VKEKALMLPMRKSKSAAKGGTPLIIPLLLSLF